LLAKKPGAPISASPGALGATKAQVHLRAIMSHLGMCVLSRPSLAIPKVREKISDGVIHDKTTRRFVGDWLQEFQDWVVQLNK
jgi:chromate reductase